MAGELERGWNERFAVSRGLKRRSAASAAISRPPFPMTSAWCCWRLPTTYAAVVPPAASAETRKRILRAVLNEIVVAVEADRLHLRLH